MDGTKTTNTELALFRNSPRMAYLSAVGTKVTDAALAQIKEYKNLSYLNLRRTGVTAEDTAGVVRALPNYPIECNGGMIERKRK